jgi:hypothetical protein
LLPIDSRWVRRAPKHGRERIVSAWGLMATVAVRAARWPYQSDGIS